MGTTAMGITSFDDYNPYETKQSMFPQREEQVPRRAKRVSRGIKSYMSKLRKEVQVKTEAKKLEALPEVITPVKKRINLSEIPKFEVETELDKFQKRLEQYDRHDKMSKEKELAELEKALEKRRQLKSRDKMRSTRKNFNVDRENQNKTVQEEEKRIAEEF